MNRILVADDYCGIYSFEKFVNENKYLIHNNLTHCVDDSIHQMKMIFIAIEQYYREVRAALNYNDFVSSEALDEFDTYFDEKILEYFENQFDIYLNKLSSNWIKSITNNINGFIEFLIKEINNKSSVDTFKLWLESEMMYEYPIINGLK